MGLNKLSRSRVRNVHHKVVALHFEALETRLLLASDVFQMGNTLVVAGDNASQQVEIVDFGGGSIDLQCVDKSESAALDGSAVDGTLVHSFSSIERVIVRLAGGDDDLTYRYSPTTFGESFPVDLVARLGAGEDSFTAELEPGGSLQGGSDGFLEELLTTELTWDVSTGSDADTVFISGTVPDSFNGNGSVFMLDVDTGGANDSIWIDLGMPVRVRPEHQSNEEISTFDISIDSGVGDDAVDVALGVDTGNENENDSNPVSDSSFFDVYFDLTTTHQFAEDDDSVNVVMTGLPATESRDAVPLRLNSVRIEVESGHGGSLNSVRIEDVQLSGNLEVENIGPLDLTLDRVQVGGDLSATGRQISGWPIQILPDLGNGVVMSITDLVVSGDVEIEQSGFGDLVTEISHASVGGNVRANLHSFGGLRLQSSAREGALLSVNDLVVSGDVEIQRMGGGLAAEFTSLTVAGNFDIHSQGVSRTQDSTIELTEVTIGGELSVSTGAGDQWLVLESVYVGMQTRIDLGAGNDRLQISDSIFADSARFDGGPGYDLLLLSDVQFQNGSSFVDFGSQRRIRN